MTVGMTAVSSVHADLSAKAGRQREQAEHQPRPSRVRITVDVAGIGETRLAGQKSVDFGAYLLDEPSFTWGVQTVSPVQLGQLPMCTAMVTRYVQNASGLYIGADMAFRVDSALSNIRLKFSLTFEASTVRSTSGLGTSTNDAPRGTNTYAGPAPS